MSKKKNVKKILAYKSHIKTTESSQKQLTKQLEFTIVTLHTYYKNTRVKSIQRCLQVTRNHDPRYDTKKCVKNRAKNHIKPHQNIQYLTLEDFTTHKKVDSMNY